MTSSTSDTPSSVSKFTTMTPEQTTSTYVVTDYLEYGVMSGDFSLIGDDKSSFALQSQTQIFVGDGSSGGFTRVYVGTNGIIGLGEVYNSISINEMHSSELGERQIICPFWTDLTTIESSSAVYYQIYTRGIQKHNDAISKANVIIREFYSQDYSNFETTWLVKVTWKEMSLYADKSQRVTIQCLIITDGENTFAVFNYIDVNLKHIRNLRISMGYRFKKFYAQNPYSNQQAAFRMSSVPGNRGVNGFWIYKLTTEVRLSKEERECFTWYLKNKDSGIANRLFNMAQFIQCPCDSGLLRFDPRFAFSRIDYKYNVICYATMTIGRNAECCYPFIVAPWSWWWWWRPALGSCRRSSPAAGTMLEYNPFLQRFSSHINDVRPKEICCTSGHCEWFYEVRPITRCYRRSPFRAAWFFGDPHIGTLDGHQYTFNGYGEYTMMKINTNATQFELQARTDLATNENGTTINATIFSAFAAGDQSGAIVQVEMSRNRDKMYIRGDDRDLTREFENLNFTYTTPYLSLRQENRTIVASFLNTSITIKISLGVRFLTCEAVVSEDYKGRVSGLMGNFDGNSSNDFLLPNGTTLMGPSVQNERNIYNNFGQAWSISAKTSIFHYDAGLSHDNYTHPAFLPFFIDEFSEEKRNQSKQVCGESQACIFDFLATGDKSLAAASGSEQITSESNTKTIENETPNIHGDSIIEAQVNVPVQMKFNISDDGQVKYKFLQWPNKNFVFDNLTGTASWTPYDTNVTTISVTAVDDQNVEASPLDVLIVLCSGCNNNGQCNFTITRNSENELFKRAVCDCVIGYEGDDCEIDIDGCADYPCALGRDCIDLKPDEEQAMGRGYNCSECPKGFVEIHSKCEDLNECNTTRAVCNTKTEYCENTEGGYLCNCMPGYRKVEGVCRDIDECQESTSGCTQRCNNTEGEFVCSCFPGFNLSADNKTCTETETDKCKKFNLTCEYTCDNSSEGYKCICKNGYELASNGINCTDINECQQGVCAQDCDNSIGSFTCHCFSGYMLNDDKTTCSACIPPNYGENCAQVCQCGAGVDRCDSVSGCVCLPGWTGDKCDQDVNECTDNPAICGTDKICQNLQGSYRCDCRSGFEKNGEDCKDINECANAGLNSCPVFSTCANTVGNYTCQCLEGYKQNSAYDCEDVDECTSGVAGCSQGCINREGGFNCECEFGFTLDDDRKTCVVVTDICSLYPALNCSFGCKQDEHDETIGHCFCGAGFHLNAQDKSSCVDINECGNESLNLCTFKDSCLNIVGSYNCSCPIGYLLENDGRTCSECDTHHYGPGCKTPCNCGTGASTCDKVLGCQCKTGWAGAKCDADIDECASSNPCSGANQVCLNIPGSFRCICEPGYNETTTNNCTDIDECQQNPCDHLCNNIKGGYVCSCNPGFKLVSQAKCEDIDECSSPQPPCDQLCANSEGSYKCSCRDGFVLNTTTKSTCYAKNECTKLNCSQHCAVRSNLTEYCFCDIGFYLNPDDSTICNDTNECLSNPCSDNCTENGPGQGYQCSCGPGKKLDVDLRTCIDCSNGYYGVNCSERCMCHFENTESCDTITGTCNCTSGWTGPNCSEDINECNGSVTCPDNSDCHNLNGTYRCNCHIGFSMAEGQCVSCSSSSFGQDCGLQCTCDFSNTLSCDKQNGTCYCSDGWQGINCTEDIKECTNETQKCGNNAVCKDTIGSFDCHCKEGYEKSHEVCENINECVRGIHNCSKKADCEDQPGSFNCSCISGYIGNGYYCTACSNTTFGIQCSQACNCVVEHTVDCVDSTGECICKENWNGSQCEIHVKDCQNGNFVCDPKKEKCAKENGTENYFCVCLYGTNSTYETCLSPLAPHNPTDEEVRYEATATFEINVSQTEFEELTTNITDNLKELLTIHFRDKVGADRFKDLAVLSIRLGSLIAHFEAIFKKTTDLEKVTSAFVKAMHDLAKQTFPIESLHKNASVILIIDDKNATITRDSTSLCSVFERHFPCPPDKQCEETSELPACVALKGTDHTELIIGLGIGIPLLLATIVIVIITIVYCKRGSSKSDSGDGSESERSSEGNDFFRNVVPVRFGSWGPLYSPWGPKSDHNIRDTTEPEPSFQGSWYYDDSTSRSPQPEQFSWDFVRAMIPKDQTFEIQRPLTDNIPNPLYTNIESNTDDVHV